MTDKNRRIHKRVPIVGFASLVFNNGEYEELTEGMISNISYSGIGIYADRQLSEGTGVSMKINFISSDWTVTETSLKGNIAYTNEIDVLFFTGIEFTDEIDPGKQKSLYYHIDQSLQWY